MSKLNTTKNKVIFKVSIFYSFMQLYFLQNGGLPALYGNNYPLRGAKSTIYEGGTRAAAFVHGAGLTKTGFTYDG